MKFQLTNKEIVKRFTSSRSLELKLGEKILVGADYYENLKSCEAKYVIIGIPEDIGPRANCGRGGSTSAWEPFLSKFLNIQESDLINGNQILLYGYFDFSDVKPTDELAELREQVFQLDLLVSDKICEVVKAGKIPIVIGGGHNNSYGIIKGASLAKGKAINTCNLDPHADYRPLEGRHSGNGFSYAKAEGFLDQYSMLGLHENYNSQEMMERIRKENIHFISFEDIFLREKISFNAAVSECKSRVKSGSYGIELDMDSIENFPSSAQSPSGVSANQARYFVYQMAYSKNTCYLHLPEAAPSLVDNSSDQVGKLLAYLVSDFVKANSVF